jgi:SAM-dependent methyltransferase
MKSAEKCSRADSGARFGGLAEDYDRYRPRYPAAAIDWILSETDVTPVVADIGAGTGISARPFLERGCRVIGVEPNADMRAASEQALRAFPEYVTQPGDASHTGLADASVDLIVAAQAFHWFDRAAARAEFARVLRPGGRVCLLFNNRDTASDAFSRDYEALLLAHSVDYTQVNHANLPPEVFDLFFDSYVLEHFPNEQVLDFEGLLGRVRSCSYVPREGEGGYGALLEGLRRLFDTQQDSGHVVMRYDTEVYRGSVRAQTDAEDSSV